MDEIGRLGERELKRKLFYAALGECITAWADIERTLFDLFFGALYIRVDNSAKEKPALIFWAIPTFGMRLSYTSMLVTHCLKIEDGKQTEAQKRWKKLNNELETMYKFRNNLAHQPIAEDEVIPPADEDDTYMVIWAEEMIIPNILDKKKSFKPIEHSDLEAHLIAVSILRAQLSRFVFDFPALEEDARLNKSCTI